MIVRFIVLVFLLLVSAACGPTEPSCSYSVTPTLVTPCMAAWQGTATVVTQPSCAWTAVPTANWITIAGQSGSTGQGTFTFTVSENYAPPREAAIRVQKPGASDGQTVRVAQGGCTYTLSAESTTIPAAGADGTFDVYPMAQPVECGGPLQDRCTWTAQANVPWVTILSGAGSDIGRVSFRVAANVDQAARTGTITVRYKTFLITQSGR